MRTIEVLQLVVAITMLMSGAFMAASGDVPFWIWGPVTFVGGFSIPMPSRF